MTELLNAVYSLFLVERVVLRKISSLFPFIVLVVLLGLIIFYARMVSSQSDDLKPHSGPQPVGMRSYDPSIKEMKEHAPCNAWSYQTERAMRGAFQGTYGFSRP